eukprot:COSAG05_NODE_1741_length_4161_cov_1.817824_4_plen_154_part_00
MASCSLQPAACSLQQQQSIHPACAPSVEAQVQYAVKHLPAFWARALLQCGNGCGCTAADPAHRLWKEALHRSNTTAFGIDGRERGMERMPPVQPPPVSILDALDCATATEQLRNGSLFVPGVDAAEAVNRVYVLGGMGLLGLWCALRTWLLRM